MKNEILVFLGPSLPTKEARKILDATYLPPVKCGDLLLAYRLFPKVVIIIDGYFEQTASVWHKEILFLLSKGIVVVGATSMGALRAAELSSYGMIGIGSIFEFYRDELLEDDDEVTLLHAGEEEYGYFQISLPMVDIRFTILKAMQAGFLTYEQGEHLKQVAKNQFYPKRTLQLLTSDTVAGAGLKKYLDLNNMQSLKRKDTIEVLEWAAKFSALDNKKSFSFEFNWTTFFNNLWVKKSIQTIQWRGVVLNPVEEINKEYCKNHILVLTARLLFFIYVLADQKQSLLELSKNKAIDDVFWPKLQEEVLKKITLLKHHPSNEIYTSVVKKIIHFMHHHHTLDITTYEKDFSIILKAKGNSSYNSQSYEKIIISMWATVDSILEPKINIDTEIRDLYIIDFLNSLHKSNTVLSDSNLVYIKRCAERLSRLNKAISTDFRFILKVKEIDVPINWISLANLFQFNKISL